MSGESVDADQKAQNEASDLGLHCLSTSACPTTQRKMAFLTTFLFSVFIYK